MPIERGRPGPGLLAEVIVRKYGDHLPLERQSGIFAREGVEISKQTLCDWVAAMAHGLSPIYRAMRERVLASPIVQTDETGLRVLRNKHSKKRKGNVWICAGKPGELFYAYTMTKESKTIRKLFKGFRGYLQADAYPGFDSLYRDETVIEVGCHAHARRRFVKAYEKGEQHAAWALAAYKQLYDVEREAREEGLAPETRRLLREERSRPILESFYTWLEGLRESLRPSSLLADAVRYALNQREALWRFLDDGRLEIDNNRSERTLRKVALGRNNYLFAGSPQGAETAMVHYTLVWACKEIGVNPAEYLRDVIGRLATHPNSEVEKLCPVEWKAARASLIETSPDTS
jgi:transposase